MNQCESMVGYEPYQYTVYGLNIDSEIMLPELMIRSVGAADVQVVLGDVMKQIDHKLPDFECYLLPAGDKALFITKGVASYCITGKQITVEPFLQADLGMVKLYLLGTVMGIVLQQRGLMPMHGSTAVINGQAVLFTGLSGAGKSTMAAALHQRGFDLLADDVSALRCDENGVFWVQPGYPQQKLWPQSTNLLGMDTNGFRVVSTQWEKYAIPLPKGFYKMPLPLAAVYVFVLAEGGGIAIRPLTGTLKMMAIMQNIYRVELIAALGLTVQHFEKCAAISKQSAVFQLTRPKNVDTLNQLVETVLRHFAECSKCINKEEKDEEKYQFRDGGSTSQRTNSCRHG
ncbi:MAG: phosphoenolpyruvate carboxykinase (ATP) [Pelosinus sp.]|nr:phosphoenolpyruvate carboxykinase (ATP) [Pelosinus sp.]